MFRILAVIISVLAVQPTVAFSAANECDYHAAHPYDPVKSTDGVSFSAIDPALALMSCGAAYSEQPDVVRYKYQYGRALLAAKRPIEAIIFIRSAANSGYAAAQQSLATMLYDGTGLSADKIAAIRLFHKAAAQGHAVAQLRVASFYLRGEGGLRDLVKARQFAQKAADKGLPAARTALKMIVDRTAPQH